MEDHGRDIGFGTAPAPVVPAQEARRLGPTAVNEPTATTLAEEAVARVSAALAAKPSNPKDIIGSDKLPMGLVPDSVIAYAALAWLEGMLKYGLVNWRECGVRASIYLDAMQRHRAKFREGQWADPHTRVPHLASIIACAGILLDAELNGKLIDDRPLSTPNFDVFLDDLGDNVKHLKQLFADKNPHHYTVEDNPVPVELPTAKA
jgi:hypothetical protein